MNAYSPIVPPQTIVAFAPIDAPASPVSGGTRLAGDMAPGVQDIGEDTARPAEHIVLELDPS